MAEKILNWAVLGVGVIANEMAQALHKQGKNLYAVANRTHDKAVAFAEKYNVAKVYDTIDEIFTDEAVDVIYITTPHNTHYQFMKRALENGKHLLVEKSITLNSRELDEMIALAAEKNLILAEAMTIWHMPLYKTLWKRISAGDFGKVQIITLNFGSFKEYALSIVRSFMAETPTEILSQWQPSPTGSDEMATILLKNSCGQMATVALSMHSKQPKRAVISCERGYIEIMEYPRAEKAIFVDAETGAVEEIFAGKKVDALFYEMSDMDQAIKSGDASAMKLAFSKDVMDIMTALRKNWNLRYPKEVW